MTDAEIRTAVRAFCLHICPDLAPEHAVAAYANRSPTPKPGTSWCRLGVLGSTRTSSNLTECTESEAYRVIKPAQYHVQVDFYGPQAATWAELFSTLWQDATGCDFLVAYHCAPLYADNPRNLTQANGEGQYEPRWEVGAYLAGRSVAGVTWDYFTGVELTTLPQL